MQRTLADWVEEAHAMERMRRELDVPEDLVVSPDCRHLYALGSWETARSYRPADAFAVFRR